MSGLVSGIGKVFSTVGNAVTRVASSVIGVGAAATTAAVATGAGSMASGGLNGVVSGLTGGGVLGNVITGAIKTAGYGALIGGVVGMVTGQGFGKGALMGAAGGALTGGLMAGMGGMRTTPTGLVTADTPTGMSPTGSTINTSAGVPNPSIPTGGSYVASAPGAAAAASAATAAATPTTAGNGFLNFLNSEAGGGLLAGLGKGAADYMAARQQAQVQRENIAAQKEMQQTELNYLRNKDQRLQDSYEVADSAFAAPPAGGNSGGAPGGSTKMRYEYDPAQGKIVMMGA